MLKLKSPFKYCKHPSKKAYLLGVPALGEDVVQDWGVAFHPQDKLHSPLPLHRRIELLLHGAGRLLQN